MFLPPKFCKPKFSKSPKPLSPTLLLTGPSPSSSTGPAPSLLFLFFHFSSSTRRRLLAGAKFAAAHHHDAAPVPRQLPLCSAHLPILFSSPDFSPRELFFFSFASSFRPPSNRRRSEVSADVFFASPLDSSSGVGSPHFPLLPHRINSVFVQ